MTVTDITFKTPQITAYPNPTDDVSIISLNNPAKGTVMVSVFNMSGRLVKQYTTIKKEFSFNHPLSLHDQPRGIYLVKFKIDNIVKSVKIFKQ